MFIPNLFGLHRFTGQVNITRVLCVFGGQPNANRRDTIVIAIELDEALFLRTSFQTNAYLINLGTLPKRTRGRVHV